MTMPSASQNKRRALYRNLLIAAMGVLALLAIAGGAFGVDVHDAALGVVVACAVLSMLQFTSLDEMAKQAHYVAWYWGSFVALIAIGALAVGLASGLLPFAPVEALIAQWHGRADPEAGFITGLVVGLALLFASFVVWWTAHWLRMR